MYLHTLTRHASLLAFAGLGTALIGVAAACADTIYVNNATGNDTWNGRCSVWDGGTCGPKKTIQAGMDSSADGDMVSIADGVYKGTGNRDLSFPARAIVVCSEGGMSNCIIDCESAARGVSFTSGTTRASIFEGIGIHWGSSSRGGGMYVDGAPTIRDCELYRCRATLEGGGIYVSNVGDAAITGCMILANIAQRAGAGIYSRGRLRVDQCNLIWNLASDENDHTANWGGGIDASAPATIERSLIAHNRAGDSTPADAHGGGVCLVGPVTVSNCIVAYNLASGSASYTNGGGAYLRANAAGAPVICNCTFAFNTVFEGSGAAIATADSESVVMNSILWGWGEAVYGTPTIANCVVRGGWEESGYGNIDLDPSLVDPDGPDNYGDTWADNDYRLAAGSPCIDAGSNAYVEPSTVDFEGNARRSDDPATPDCQWAPETCGPAPIVDIGAYEYSAPPVRHGDANCDGQVDFGDINPFVDALLNATYCDTTGANADVNGNGSVGFEDINPFVNLLTTGTLPIICR